MHIHVPYIKWLFLWGTNISILQYLNTIEVTKYNINPKISHQPNICDRQYMSLGTGARKVCKVSNVFIIWLLKKNNHFYGYTNKTFNKI